MTRRILPALLAGVLLVAGCGDDDADSGSASANPVDKAFVEQMLAHHLSAVQMARTAQRRGSSTFVTRLADDIVRTQSAEITTLRAANQRLEAAGVRTGSLGVPAHMMGRDDDPAKLKTARPFDPAFLKMMIGHHDGAIEMADAERTKGKDPQLKTLAQRIIAAQAREIDAMRTQLDGRDAGMNEHRGEHDAEHPG